MINSGWELAFFGTGWIVIGMLYVGGYTLIWRWAKRRRDQDRWGG